MTTTAFQPEFADYIPSDLEPGILYVSLKYATAVHLCACGCRQKVVTPLSRTGWRLTFDGTVSLYPSIGNWQYPCQSHYFIRGNRIVWARRFTPGEIESSQKRDTETQQGDHESTTKTRLRARISRLALSPANRRPR
jgi:hypothetical protein